MGSTKVTASVSSPKLDIPSSWTKGQKWGLGLMIGGGAVVLVGIVALSLFKGYPALFDSVNHVELSSAIVMGGGALIFLGGIYLYRRAQNPEKQALKAGKIHPSPQGLPFPETVEELPLAKENEQLRKDNQLKDKEYCLKRTSEGGVVLFQKGFSMLLGTLEEARRYISNTPIRKMSLS